MYTEREKFIVRLQQVLFDANMPTYKIDGPVTNDTYIGVKLDGVEHVLIVCADRKK
jgi:hypothetical protein